MYQVINKVTNETSEMQLKAVMNVVKEIFPKSGPSFHNFMYTRISLLRTMPYENDFIKIINLDAKPSKKQVPKFPELPANEDLKIGNKRTINTWFVYNDNSDKCAEFPNLAALARAFDIDYSYLYRNITGGHSFKLGKFTISRTFVLEREFYDERIKDIL